MDYLIYEYRFPKEDIIQNSYIEAIEVVIKYLSEPNIIMPADKDISQELRTLFSIMRVLNRNKAEKDKRDLANKPEYR